MKWLIVPMLFLWPVFGYTQSETVQIEALVPGCGNLVIEAGEACDGTNLGGQSCSTVGFSSGPLSCASNCTFVTAGCVLAPPPTSSAGGGGTRVRSLQTNTVVLEGTAPPSSVVWLLRDGVRVTSVVSNAAGKFMFSVPSFPVGVHTMSMYVEARDGLRSSAFSFPLSATSRGVTKFETFSLSPTIDISHVGVQVGQPLDVYGDTTPNSTVVVVIYKDGKALIQTTERSTVAGKYNILVSTNNLAPGSYTVLTYTIADNKASAPSRLMSVTVGEIKLPRYRDFDTCAFIRGDVNRDCRVDFRDIMMTKQWQYGQGIGMGLAELERLSGDGRIDMRDFSIILYNWTG